MRAWLLFSYFFNDLAWKFNILFQRLGARELHRGGVPAISGQLSVLGSVCQAVDRQKAK